jgi:hypothetical protein
MGNTSWNVTLDVYGGLMDRHDEPIADTHDTHILEHIATP